MTHRTPRPYQQRAIDAVRHRWEHGARCVCLVIPTGGGKTFTAARLCNGSRVLWIAHRRELIDQAAEALRAEFDPRDVGIIAPGHDRHPAARVQVATVQTLLARGDRPAADLVVLDECHHHIAADWARVHEAYPEARALGLTATPERSDGKPLGDLFDALVVGATYSELLEDGYLVPCRVYQPPTSLGARELAQDPLAAYQRYTPGAQAFVFMGSVRLAYEQADRFTAAGIPSAVVEAKSKRADRVKALADFSSGRVQCLMNVMCLDSETEILTQRGWLGHADIADTDYVAQWDNGYVDFVTPSQIVRRERAPGEAMVALESRRRSVRVTAGHRMAYRTAQHGAWRDCTAGELAGRDVEVPISGTLRTPPPATPLPVENGPKSHMARRIASNAHMLRVRDRGLTVSESRRVAAARIADREALRYKRPEELTIDECSLIGFWLGDGSCCHLNGGGVEYTLCQCSDDSGIVRWIDATIANCGIHAIKRERRCGSNATQWSLPRGTGFGAQRRAGVYPLAPYLIKGGSALYWQFSSSQVDALLHGFWLAEGNHGPDGNVPRGYKASNTDRGLLDLLQALAVCHGYRATICGGSQRTASSRPLWDITWRADADSHRASKRGAVFTMDESPANETVWCVTVPSGYIVTRRRGSVTVVGNCLTEGVDVPSASAIILARGCDHVGLYLQVAGRILRPYPGKPEATLVDLTGASLQHGLPTADRSYSLEGDGISGPSVQALRNCLKCGACYPSRPGPCPECGYDPPVRVPPPPRIYSLELREVFAGADTPAAAKRREYERLRAVARERGWALYWVCKEYRKLFGALPIIDDATEDERVRELSRLIALVRERGYKPGFAAVRYRELFGSWPTDSLRRRAEEAIVLEAAS